MVKIDQKFLDEVARQHNIDYPKEYWESGGKQANESKKKAKASRKNGKLGGRPKKEQECPLKVVETEVINGNNEALINIDPKTFGKAKLVRA